MSTTSTTPPHTDRPNPDPGIGGSRRAAAISLVGGAALLAAGRALSLPGGSPAQRLEQVAGHQVQVAASVVLAVAGFAALIPGLLAVASRVRGRGELLATIGSGLSVAGLTGFAVLVSIDASTAAAGKVDSAAAMQAFLHQLDMSPSVLVITAVAVIGYFVGPFLVALAARRARLVPRWLPWGVLASLVVQPVGAGLGGPWVAHVLDIALQLVLVVMMVVLARQTLLTRSQPAAADHTWRT